MKLIFLDIDGVLNSWEWWKKEEAHGSTIGWNKVDSTACSRLNNIIEATGAKVIISSTWRKILIPGEIFRILKECGFNGEVIGVTPILYKKRGIEIQACLDEFVDAPESFVILDDDADMEHLMPYLVQTSCDTGLQDRHVEEAIKILNSTQNTVDK